MKKLFLLISLVIFSLAGCTQSSKDNFLNKYDDIVNHFEERDSSVVSIHKSENGSLTILVLSDYRVEIYQALLVGEEYQYSLINYL